MLGRLGYALASANLEEQRVKSASQRSATEADAPMPTRLFRNGNSQAVRIPKAFAFENVDVEVEIERYGDALVIRPKRRKFSGLGASLRRLKPYFRNYQRQQPSQDERDWAPRMDSESQSGSHLQKPN